MYSDGIKEWLELTKQYLTADEIKDAMNEGKEKAQAFKKADAKFDIAKIQKYPAFKGFWEKRHLLRRIVPSKSTVIAISSFGLVVIEGCDWYDPQPQFYSWDMYGKNWALTKKELE